MFDHVYLDDKKAATNASQRFVVRCWQENTYRKPKTSKSCFEEIRLGQNRSQEHVCFWAYFGEGIIFTSKKNISRQKRARNLAIFHIVVLISTTNWKFDSHVARFMLEILYFEVFSFHGMVITMKRPIRKSVFRAKLRNGKVNS